MSLGRSRALLTLVSVAALWFIAPSSPSRAAPPDSTQIVIKDFTFTPNSLTVKAGSTVTWVNKDDEPHNVVSDTGSFRSGAVDTDETFRSSSTNRARTPTTAPFTLEWSRRS
jgi:plastocyanin